METIETGLNQPPQSLPVDPDGALEQRIRQFVSAELLFDAEAQVDEEASFIREGIVDSTGVMELVAFVQSAFEIEIHQREVTLENFDSVRRLAQFIRLKQGPREVQPGTSLPEADPGD